MLSTLLTYRLKADDMARSLALVAAQATTQRDADYYARTIGTVRTVDEFMADRRLYTHALKAHGLQDQANSQAFVRKILESDLSDTSSFVNRLADQRYRAFAAAFDFSATAAKPQSQAQTDRVVEAYSEHQVRSASIAAEKVAYYDRIMPNIRSVDQFLADPTLFEMTTRILGLDPAITSKTFLRGVLTGASANDPATPLTGDFLWLSEQFNFDGPDGTVPVGQVAQTAAGRALFADRYNEVTDNRLSPQATAQRGRYFESAIASIGSARNLVDDPILLSVALTSVGLAATESAENIRELLSNPAAILAGMPTRTSDEIARKEKYAALANALVFDANGNAQAGGPVTAEKLRALLDGYYTNAPVADASSTLALDTNRFRLRLTGMNTINDLLRAEPGGKRPALEYVLKAFDIDPSTASLSMVRRVLTSDPSDPKSYVSRLDDPRWSNLAAAFNFDESGKVRAERLAQPVRAQQATAFAYAESFGADRSEAQKTAIRKATEDYLAAVGGITSLDDLVSNKTVMAFAGKAYGLDPALDEGTLRKILTSDLTDPKSLANANVAWREFAGSFEVRPDGRIGLSGDSIQRSSEIYTTQNLFLLQTLEEQVGAENEGARLALYFLRKGPDIKNAFSILSDKALFEVVRTALNLPVSLSQLDIDRQAAILEDKLDFSDFTDPAKLDRFVSRFAALYDLQNASAASDPILALFGGGGGTAAPGVLGLF